jgi:hypothetical protein
MGVRQPEYYRDRATLAAAPRPLVMTRPAVYRQRMIVFLGVIAIVVLMLHAQALQFFLRNPPSIR